MKTEYSVNLKCDTCGSEDHFEYNEDKNYVKCTMCGRKYFGGIDELKELNQETFDSVKRGDCIRGEKRNPKCVQWI